MTLSYAICLLSLESTKITSKDEGNEKRVTNVLVNLNLLMQYLCFRLHVKCLIVKKINVNRKVTEMVNPRKVKYMLREKDVV